MSTTAGASPAEDLLQIEMTKIAAKATKFHKHRRWSRTAAHSITYGGIALPIVSAGAIFTELVAATAAGIVSLAGGILAGISQQGIIQKQANRHTVFKAQWSSVYRNGEVLKARLTGPEMREDQKLEVLNEWIREINQLDEDQAGEAQL